MGTWDDVWKEQPKKNFYDWLILKLLVKDLEKILKKQKPEKILVVGCGRGDTFATLKEKGFQNIKGIDYSMKSVKLCQQKGLDVAFRSAEKIPFADNSFDMVLAEDCIPFVKDLDKATGEFSRVSEKSLVIIPNYSSLITKFTRRISKILPDYHDKKIENIEASFQKNNSKLADMIRKRNSIFLVFQRV